jgi:Ca-activated chloride channel family protein
MSFAAPAWLWSLLLVPALVVLELWLTARDRKRLSQLVARPLWNRVVARPLAVWRWVRLALFCLGAAGISLALARPQWGVVREKVEREGVDVVMVLDCSGSMATDDVAPNRFFLARAALSSLMEQLEGDRFALVVFEGEAYPLVPLTLDADAIGLFLDTLEPGVVPAPGTSLGAGLQRGLAMFVDEERANKVMVLVSDGEDLEGNVPPLVRQAKEAGVAIHTVGVGTERGAPVPDFDADGKQVGFKKDEDGSVVVSRLNAATLEAIARGTGGQFVRISPSDTSLWQLAAAIAAMEKKTLARDWAYRKKERYQVPLAVALLAFATALLLPLPLPRRSPTPARPATRGAATLAALLLATASTPAAAQHGKLLDELLLRPQRLTAAGREAYRGGNHPKALASFEAAAATRAQDLRLRFNLADGLYKNGKYDEAAAIFRAIGSADSPLAGAARYNLGNTLFQKQDYAGAVRAFREALELMPDDLDTRHNLELALRALEEQQRRQQQSPRGGEQGGKPEQNPEPKAPPEPSSQPNRHESPRPQAKTPEEAEKERFLAETGMPRERALQLLEALEANEKAEHRKQLAAQRASKKKGKDW